MNPEIFTPRPNIRYYLVQGFMLIFGVPILYSGIGAHESSLIITGCLSLFGFVLMLLGFPTEIHLGSMGLVIKRPWRTGQFFSYDRLSAINRTQILIGNDKIPVIIMANGNELIEMLKERMNEGMIPRREVETVREAQAKNELRADSSGAISQTILLFVIAGLAFLLVFLIRWMFGVEVNIWFGVLAALLVLAFLFGVSVARGEDMKGRISSGLHFLTYPIVWIGIASLFFFPFKWLLGVLFGPDVVSNPLIFWLTFFPALSLAILGGVYLYDKVAQWIKKHPWMQ